VPAAETVPSTKRPFAAAIAVAGAMLLCPGATMAEPMLCSGDFYKACTSDCVKLARRAAIPSCLTGCRTLLQQCMQTGCWDGPTNRYCSLLRK
jgi:hypothetical protein